jgi:hypothetical protein
MSIINDLTPAIVDVTIPQGSYTTEFFQLYSDELQTIPLDLSGFTAESMIRLTYDSSTPILTLSTENGKLMLGAKVVGDKIEYDSPINGGIALIYDDVTTAAVRFKGDVWEGVRDVELEDGMGVRKRILMGNFTLSREVTR